MKKYSRFSKLLCLFFISLLSFQAYSENAPATKPLLLMENKGQVLDVAGGNRNDVKFTFNSGGIKLFIRNRGISYQFMNPLSAKKMEAQLVDMNLIGASIPTEIIPEDKSDYFENFYSGNQAIKDVHGYSKLTFKNIYPKIDWVIYTKGNTLEYDFVLHPGADPKSIKISYSNANSVGINTDGSLKIASKLGYLIEGKPTSLMADDKKEVNSKFVMENSVIQFEVENYDVNKTLIIDPTLVWSRYFGGSMEESITKVTTTMAMGYTASTVGILVNGSSGVQTIFGGMRDAFYSYFDSTGTTLYSVYFGGAGSDEALSGLFISNSSNSRVVMVGSTTSSQGITKNNALTDTVLNGSSDGFIAVFQLNGSLLVSSYFGGDSTDYISDVILTGAANDYTKLAICGVTNSASGFPGSGVYNGGSDAFIASIDLSGDSLSTKLFRYFGGASNEIANTLSKGKNNTFFLSGNTESSAGIATVGAFKTTLGGTDDDYLACFNANLNLKWATYFGGNSSSGNANASEKTGSANDGSYCALDTAGNAYLLGNTTSSGLATGTGNNTNWLGNEDLFLAKFDTSGNRIWTKYLGGIYSEIATSIAVNSNNLVLIGGYSDSPDMDINGIKLVVQSTHYEDDIDALLAEFTTDGVLRWSSPIGTAQGNEQINSVAVNSNNILVGGSTTSPVGLAINNTSSFYSGSTDGLLARLNDRAIFTKPISNTSLCPGDSILVPFTLIGNFPTNTIFFAYLFPNFTTTSPISLGSKITNVSGTIRGYLPKNTAASLAGNRIEVRAAIVSPPPISSSSQSVGAIGALPNAHINALTSTNICEGSSVVLKSPSNTNIIFRQWYKQTSGQWNAISGANSISYSADSAGAYRVVTTSVTSCDSTSNIINVTVQPIPDAIISSPSQVFCLGDNLILNANTGAGYSYQWYKNNLPLNGRISDTLVVNQSGYYSVRVTNSGGCSTLSPQFVATSLPKPTATITSQGITEICEGQNIALTAGGSSLGLFYAWYKNDTLIPGATFQSYVVTATGDYYVKELNSYSCGDSSNVIHVDVYPYPTPSIQYSGLPYTCLGSTVNLTTQNQANYTYQWLLNGTLIPAATDTNYLASASGNYTVTVTNHGICSTASAAYQINPPPPPTYICHATVDSSSQHNIIYFQKPSDQTYIKRYVFLKEISGNTYSPVDSVDANGPEEIVDNISNPNTQAWKYLMQTVDSCGNRTLAPLSKAHTCIHLFTSYNGSVATIQWNPYVGVKADSAYYVIFRQDSSSAPFDSIGKVSYTSPTNFTDANSNLYPKAFYKIEMRYIPSCTNGNKIMAGYSSTRSNIKNRMNMSCNVDTTITQNQNTLIAGENGAVYQWLDCSTGTPTPLPGDTAQSLVVTNNGTYSVIISKGNCIDTSRCVQISLGENGPKRAVSKIRIAPNPASNSFTIYGLNSDANEIELHNFLGEKCTSVHVTKVSNDAVTIDTSKLAAGVYFVQIKGNDLNEVKKLILDK